MWFLENRELFIISRVNRKGVDDFFYLAFPFFYIYIGRMSNEKG